MYVMLIHTKTLLKNVANCQYKFHTFSHDIFLMVHAMYQKSVHNVAHIPFPVRISSVVVYRIKNIHCNAQYNPNFLNVEVYYTGWFFLTGPPDFQYQNEKQVAANQD